jgi:hypothetical protein
MSEYSVAQHSAARKAEADAIALPSMMSAAVELAIRRVLTDKELRAQFWRDGYAELEEHAGANVSQWLGRRVVNIIITAAVAAALAWVAWGPRK